jgi:hypothetical protein
MQQFKQGHDTMQTKKNLNIKQSGDVGIGNLTCLSICPHLHNEWLVFS